MNHGEFFVIGATHRTAPLGTRERLALTAEAEAGLAGDLAGLSGLGEFVVLNTCNRVEIYGVGTGRETRGRVMAAFCARQRFALPDFEKLRLDLCGPAAVQHLLEVAAGLDSQMLGENEIFGQVKKAYAAAQTRGSAGAVLNRIFQKTFQAAKHVRTHTAITSGLVSVANVAVDLAMSIFGGLGGTHVLLLGAGEIGTKSGRAFRSRGVAGLAVASRRIEHAAEVATELGGCAQSFEEGLGRLGEFDVVVCATSAPGTVVSAEAVREAMGRRQGRPLFIIDLALPRDVDAAVAGIENVFLYNLDDLACIATKNRSAREAEIGKCRVLLRARADALWSQVAAQFAATEARAGGQMDAAYSSRRLLLAATAGCPT